MRGTPFAQLPVHHLDGPGHRYAVGDHRPELGADGERLSPELLPQGRIPIACPGIPDLRVECLGVDQVRLPAVSRSVGQ